MDSAVGFDEAARLAALRRHGILDTPAERDFDALVAMAADICAAPIAVMNLVDRHRQWGKALVGMESSEVPRCVSFCARAILEEDGLLVVEDTLADPLWVRNPLVAGPEGLRFYAGASIVTPEGFRLGTICVADRVPRRLEERQLNALRALARQAAAQMQLRAALADLSREQTLAASRNRILEMIASDAELADVAGDLLSGVESACAAMLTCIMVPDQEGRLRQVAGPSLPQAYLDAIDGAAIGPASGSCGTAAHTGERIIVEDISTNPLWEHHRDAALAHGLRACWSLPVLDVTGKVLATLAAYLREPRKPYPDELALLDGVVEIVHLAIARSDAKERERLGHERRERDAAVRLAATRALATATSGAEAFGSILRTLGQELGWEVGVGWLIDEREDELRCAATWTAGGASMPVVLEKTTERAFAYGEGIVGEVWRSGRTTLVDPGPGEPAFSRHRAACEAGLKGAVWLPLINDERTIGVLEFYSRERPFIDAELLQIIAAIGSDVGRFLDRKRVEEDLARERKFLLALLESLDTGVVACDQHGRLSLFNRAVGDMHGLDLDSLPADQRLARLAEARHDNLYETDARTPLDPDRAPLVRAFHGEVIRDVEMVVAPNGVEPRLVLTNGQAIRDEHGGTLGAVVAMHDITEHKRAEREREELLRQRQEQIGRLREMDRLKDVFVSSVSHELRTPLTSICGYMEILLEEQHRFDADQRQCLGTVARNADRLHRLVTDLLDLSRSDAGMLRMEVGPVSLSEITRESVDSVRALAASKRIRLRAHVPDGLECRGDAGRLAQGLDNVIANAVKYTDPDGEVHVTARPEGTGVRIEVADSGIGIPEDERQRLFERFFRASTATDAGIPGTGLGLSITKTIVEAHAGTIEAHGRAGGGTLFTVTLPGALSMAAPGQAA